jgi:hypothetical protein
MTSFLKERMLFNIYGRERDEGQLAVDLSFSLSPLSLFLLSPPSHPHANKTMGRIDKQQNKPKTTSMR